MKTSVTVLFLFALCASVAQAEEILWSMDNPPLNEVIQIDLGAMVENVLGIHITVAGYGGGQYGSCSDGISQYDMDLNSTFTVHLNSITWYVVPPLSASFEYGNYWSYGLGGGPLEPDALTLNLEFTVPTFGSYINCFLVDEDPFELHSVSVIVICTSAVSTDRASWSAIKALYR